VGGRKKKEKEKKRKRKRQMAPLHHNPMLLRGHHWSQPCSDSLHLSFLSFSFSFLFVFSLLFEWLSITKSFRK